ncbi:hypothetical protein [Pyxidicoccus xibeiensis]|uniref:hypothetical protein n=1 Tax=Pyxidicoccus xibeiensis TaxID=2906759 RepID=UPI0020A704AD|nr:hypothetical protein [Pyxidicoccus xibeiensis]MCP3137542.1 hypothetical protein [Pyxidicoccus xibeiensis]
MHKIDSDGATPENTFANIDPETPGAEGTVVAADWLNAVQGELCHVIVAAGVELEKGTNTQLQTALNATYGRLGGENAWTETQEFEQGVNVGGSLTVGGNIDVNGSVTVDETLSVQDAILLEGTLNVNGAGSIGGGLETFGAVNMNGGALSCGSINATGDVDCSGDLAASGHASFGGNVSGQNGQLLGGLSVGENIALTGIAPTRDTGFTSAVTPSNIPRAHGRVSVVAGVITIRDGFNLASVAITSGSNLTVTFASPMSDGNYTVTGSQIIDAATTANRSVGFHSVSAASFAVRGFDGSNALINPGVGAYEFAFIVLGR